MEPQLIQGHIFLCKKNVVCKGGNGEIAYTQGKRYKCEVKSPCFPMNDPHFNCSCGFITNNQGNTHHAWPYDPEHHPWCHDSWTEFFQDLGKQ